MKKFRVKIALLIAVFSLASVNVYAKKNKDAAEETVVESPAVKTKEEKEAEKEAAKKAKEEAKAAAKAAKEAEKAAKKAAREEAKAAKKNKSEKSEQAEAAEQIEKAVAEPVEEAAVVTEASETDEAGEAPAEETKKSKRNKKKDEKNFLGWLDSSNRNINIAYGKIRFKAKPKIGTFNISIRNEDEKEIPVFSTSNEYTSTSFYLKAGNKIIKLNDDSNVKSSAQKIADGIQLGYRIKNVADVVITFNCFAAVPGGEVDSVKISSEIYNRGKKKTEMAIKFVMDTVFGETDRHHFYDMNLKPVKNEISLRAFDDEDKWYYSKNSKAAMQIVFVGTGCTQPELVALANFATLDTNQWEPEMLSYRAFDTVLSYNNSAVGVVWPSRKIAVDESKSEIFYLSFGTDGVIPVAGEMLNKKTEPEEAPAEGEGAEGEITAEGTVAPDGTVPATAETAVTDEILQETVLPDAVIEIPAVPVETPAVQPPAPQTPAVQPVQTVQIPAVEDKPKEVKQEKTDSQTAAIIDHLSETYIKGLLERIAALESSGEDVNKEELMRLNAELDSILELLQSM